MQVRPFRHASGGYAASHRHAEGQLFILKEGTCELRVGNGEWLITPERPCWIPPDQEHSAMTRGTVDGVSVLIPEEACGGLPARTCLLRYHRLLLNVVERLASVHDDAGRRARLCAVLLDEIADNDWDAMYLPMPLRPSLREVAVMVARQPADRRSVAAWAREGAVSKRTFTRLFRAETGLSFGAWRRLARAVRAVDLLASGASVTEVSLEVGYDSVGAFSVMFREAMGCSPSQFAGRGAGSRVVAHPSRTSLRPTVE